MNLFNRVILVVLLLALLATTLLCLLVPQTVLDMLRNSIDQIEAAIPFYNILSGAYWAFLGVGLLIVLLCLLLLWLELRRPRYKTVQVRDAEGRTMELGVKAITQRLQSDLEALADVSRVKPKVLSRGRKVDITLDAHVHPAVDLPTKTAEITQVTHEVIEQQMGAKVGKVRVNMQYGPAAPRPAVEPQLEPLPAEPEPELPALAEPDLELPPPAKPPAETVTPVPPAEAESPLADVPDILPETVADEDDLASPSQLEEAEYGLEQL